SGCILEADREKFLKLFDLVFPTEEMPELPDMIARYGVVTPMSKHNPEDIVGIYQFWKIDPTYQSGFEAFVPIQNGCDKFCTFCAVPYTRGREVSRPSEEILEEVYKLVEAGYKSITLLGQNVNSYGLDKKGNEISFASLLQKIGEFGEKSQKEFWVYFTSPHPRDMTEDVIDTIARYKCLAKQIHIPLQSGDDHVLIRMNRKYNLDRYMKIISNIRTKLPEATIFTDIIVGFPGENDEHFENTRKAVRDIGFNMAYIACYSPRPGATSARWENDIPLKVKKERLHILTEEMKEYTQVFNNHYIGKNLKLLVYGPDRRAGYLSGYTEGKIGVRFRSDDTNLIGKIVELKITQATPFALEGELVENSSTSLFIHETNHSI
ncbi:MAG TPA: MiaB/RimO family radical SAM methylthiotransferase, partial [Bacteroidales bacterium]|nr:MiaB/RimO family radical SAM methylthiotransferase [Bacteroidales bacterium]